ncbi:hypothetical protein LCGC14_0643590 [marine sediment metagenome]|uniref:Uncharacterized protein n=1 Tax=marine sediment metagenome TaxID=412755 RepID=A0A0F9U6W4_9ZZZZ
MAQPTITGVTLNAGSGGSDLAVDVVDSKLWQAILVGYSTGDGTANIVMADTGLPVVAATSATWVLGAGTAEIGKLAAGTATIGAVTGTGTLAVQVDGAALTALQLIDNIVSTVDGAAGATPTGVAALAIRDDALSALTPVEGDFVGLRTDANGALWIIPSGTVTVNGSGVTQPVSGTFWQGTQPISAATLPLPSGASTSANQSTGNTSLASAVTALEILDNVVYVEDAVVPANPSGIPVMMQRDDALGGITPVENDWSHSFCSAKGALWVAVDGTVTIAAAGGTIAVTKSGTWTVQAQQNGSWSVTSTSTIAGGTATQTNPVRVALDSTAVFDDTTECVVKRKSGLAATGTTAMVAAVVDKKIRILALFLKATSATVTNVYVATATDTDVFGDATNPIPLAVDADGDNDSGFVLPWNPGGWSETSTANEALNLVLSAAQDVIYAITWIEVD